MDYHEIEREDEQREQEFLDSLGPFGRLIDNDLYFMLVFVMVCGISATIGLLIGLIL